MRVVIASGHPALALALSTQLPGIEAGSASSPLTAKEQVSDDALLLLDLGSTEETTDWLNQLRSCGVDNGIVVVDAPSAVTEGLVTHLSRPFSVADLATALDTTFAEQAERRRAAAPHDEIGDAKPLGVASEPDAVDVDVGGVPLPTPAVMDVDELPALAPPTFERPPEPARRGRSSGFSKRRRRRTSGEPGRPEPGQATNRVPDSAASVRQGLQAASTLERMLGDISMLGSLANCGALLLDEIAADIAVGSSVVAMRGRAGDLELIAAGGMVAGVHVDHLAREHPFVQAVLRRGGALLLSPTDEARGILAGVPASHWPVLLAATITSEEQLEGIVIVGRDEPVDPNDLERLCSVVERSEDLLRLAASIRRLPRPDGAYLDYLHSWMR